MSRDSKGSKGSGGGTIDQLETVIDHCFNITFITKWQDFITLHQSHFTPTTTTTTTTNSYGETKHNNESKDSSSACDYTLRQYDIYLQFIDFIETNINTNSQTYDWNMQQFFVLCQQHASESIAANTFLFILPLVTDFQAFNDIMTDR